MDFTRRQVLKIGAGALGYNSGFTNLGNNADNSGEEQELDIVEDMPQIVDNHGYAADMTGSGEVTEEDAERLRYLLENDPLMEEDPRNFKHEFWLPFLDFNNDGKLDEEDIGALQSGKFQGYEGGFMDRGPLWDEDEADYTVEAAFFIGETPYQQLLENGSNPRETLEAYKETIEAWKNAELRRFYHNTGKKVNIEIDVVTDEEWRPKDIDVEERGEEIVSNEHPSVEMQAYDVAINDWDRWVEEESGVPLAKDSNVLFCNFDSYNNASRPTGFGLPGKEENGQPKNTVVMGYVIPEMEETLGEPKTVHDRQWGQMYGHENVFLLKHEFDHCLGLQTDANGSGSRRIVQYPDSIWKYPASEDQHAEIETRELADFNNREVENCVMDPRRPDSTDRILWASWSSCQERKNLLPYINHPFPNGIPGINGERPGDPDNDGLYEDTNGDQELNFEDAVALGFAETDEINNRQVKALDFEGDGDLDFDDAIELAFKS